MFESTGVGGPYSHIGMASFFKMTPFFKMIAKHAGYPADIPDKNQFLMAALRDSDFREKDPELIKLLFNNSNKTKNFEWWENANWPYPLFEKLKEEIPKRKDKANYQNLLAIFNEVDSLKKNICQLDTLDKLQQTMTKYHGMGIILTNPSTDLLSCAVNSGNKELALYLIENNLFNSLNLTKLVTQISLSEVNKNNLVLLSNLEKKMEELKIPHPDKKIKQTIWTFGHLRDEVECLQTGDNSDLLGLKTFAELAQKIVFSAFLKEVEKLKAATLEKDEKKKNKSIGNIIELFTQSGVPINFQDSSGKTIMHHLAAFADFATIGKIESSLNNQSGTMNYTIQDKLGNTPLHIALINKNMSGSLGLADEIVQRKNGFSYGIREDVRMKNLQGKTPLDIVKDLDVTKDEKKTLKTVKRWLKEHIDPKGRFDYSGY